ncbi:MAG TPA: hypothetical protein VKT77_04500 [Chthonomonadaceae bacterium]|nr:hypothetical protein [Chthonomonadaceae bacterium]
MAHAIYATFDTEHDAERAAGALLDHGVRAEDVSFVISDPLVHPTVFQQPVSLADRPAPVDVGPPPSVPLPGTISSGTASAVAERRQAAYVAAPSLPGEPGLAGPDDLPSAPLDYDIPPPTPMHLGATMLPPNTPQEIVEHVSRPHIIDMKSDRPHAADGLSTTTLADAAQGAAGGAGIGVGLGILLGIAAVMIPGVGLVAGTGALVAGLAAATGVAGGIAGGVYGYLADLGVPPHKARLLDDHLKSGSVLLHIENSGDIPEEEIMRIVRKYGATSAEGF